MVRWFVWSLPEPPMLLRRRGFLDDVWRDGRWQPTSRIVDFMFGHADDVEEISEMQARELAPAAPF